MTYNQKHVIVFNYTLNSHIKYYGCTLLAGFLEHTSKTIYKIKTTSGHWMRVHSTFVDKDHWHWMC